MTTPTVEVPSGRAQVNPPTEQLRSGLRGDAGRFKLEGVIPHRLKKQDEAETLVRSGAQLNLLRTQNNRFTYRLRQTHMSKASHEGNEPKVSQYSISQSIPRDKSDDEVRPRVVATHLSLLGCGVRLLPSSFKALHACDH